MTCPPIIVVRGAGGFGPLFVLLELDEQAVEPSGLAFEHICELQDLSLEQLREPSIAMNVIVMTTRRHDCLDSVLKGGGFFPRQHLCLRALRVKPLVPGDLPRRL